MEKMEKAGIQVDAIDALSMAEKAGSSKAVNLVLMDGCPAILTYRKSPGSRRSRTDVPKKFLEMNRKAFHSGRNS